MWSRLFGFSRLKYGRILSEMNRSRRVPLIVRFKGRRAKKTESLDLSFSDSVQAFRCKYNSELVRAYIVYFICSNTFLVKHNLMIMNTVKAIFGKRFFEYVMKLTIYGQFVAGEDKEKILPTLKRLHQFNVYPVLDYSVEEDLTEQEAVKREFESLVPEAEKKVIESSKKKKVNEQKPIGKNDQLDPDPDPQYSYHEFGDRRKGAAARTYYYLNEEICDRNLEVFKESISIVGSKDHGPALAAVKLTALGRPQLLMQLSEVIVKARKFAAAVSGHDPKDPHNVLQLHVTEEQLIQGLRSHGIEDADEFLKKVVKDKEGVLHLFPWFGIIDQDFNLNETFRIPSLQDGKMVRLTTQLSETEMQMFRNFIRRLNALFSFAKELKVPVMVDAEQTYFQPAISRISMEMMKKYNNESMIVCNTYQCYLKATFHEAQNDLEQARRENFYFGAKLVRGAYIEQERSRAAEFGYPDPTCPNFEATTEVLNKTFDEFIKYYKMYSEKGQPDRVRVMLASHNEESVKYVILQMEQMGISPSSGAVFFGQLYGMCDFITYPLGHYGYLVYKYVPYGPVAEVLPYLSRRLVENKGSTGGKQLKQALAKLNKEKTLARRELVRRLCDYQFTYTPEPPPPKSSQAQN